MAFLSTLLLIGFEFIVLLFCNTSSPSVFLYNYVSFCIVLDMTIFLLVLIGHFIYYNFDIDFRRQCIFCHAKDYSMNMSVLRDKSAWESVYFCRKHIIEVK